MRVVELLQAAKSGDCEAVRRALDSGANVNCTTDDGWTPLLEAVVHGPGIVQRLLDAGADPNIASKYGYTPLMRAAGRDTVEVVKLLIAAGADVEARDEKGFSARDLALHEGCFDAAGVVGEAVQDRLLQTGRSVIAIGSCEQLFWNRHLLELRIAPGYHRVRVELSDGTWLDDARVYDTIVLEVAPEHVGKQVVQLGVLYPDAADLLPES